MGLRNDFIAWYNNEFKTDPLFAAMSETVEASPWHREKNVGIHTDMVVSEYISWAPAQDWTVDTLLGAIACAFHDTGKPSARVEKFKPERGTYNSFAGHEIVSARLWEDYAMRNAERLAKLMRTDIHSAFVYNVYVVDFIIEHHMPYNVGDDKIKDIATTVAMLFMRSTRVFQDHLTADTHGRIADDHKEKIKSVDDWIREFDLKVNLPKIPERGPTLYLPIGPSGCGKSTLFTKLKSHAAWSEREIAYFSWDELRLHWYSTDYAKAYEMSVADPQFNNKAAKVFADLIKSGKDVYVDNTNLSRKRRKSFIDVARRSGAGYVVKAFVFPIALDTVIQRQLTRGDKNVPAHAVKQHYMSLQCPLYGEFDEIEVVNTL